MAPTRLYHGIGTDTNVAVADINNDGFGEIITAHTNGLVCAYDRNGYFLPGFPLKPTGRTDPIESLSVFDLDNDGDLRDHHRLGHTQHESQCTSMSA